VVYLVAKSGNGLFCYFAVDFSWPRRFLIEGYHYRSHTSWWCHAL